MQLGEAEGGGGGEESDSEEIEYEGSSEEMKLEESGEEVMGRIGDLGEEEEDPQPLIR